MIKISPSTNWNYWHITIISFYPSSKWQVSEKGQTHFPCLYPHLHVIYFRKLCDQENTDLEILIDLHIFSTPERDMPSVCMYICVPCQHLNSWTDFIHIRYLGQCPVTMNILAPKIGYFHRALKHKVVTFWKTALTILIKIQSFMETTSLNKTP
jgi:hypothetical protein